MVLIISCGVKKEESGKSVIRDKSESVIERERVDSSAVSLTTYRAVVVDTSVDMTGIVTITTVEQLRDSTGIIKTSFHQTKTESREYKKGFNQASNGVDLLLKDFIKERDKERLKNDISDNSSYKEEVERSSAGWWNLLWLLVPLGIVIYWRYFRR